MFSEVFISRRFQHAVILDPFKIKHGGIFIGTGRKLDGPGGLFLCFVRSK